MEVLGTGVGATAGAGWATATGAATAAGAATGAGAAAGTGAAAAGKPRPAAYRPHSAWLNATSSASFGWLVNSATTSSCVLPSTSSTKPCNAFFGPTSTNTRAPASYSVRNPFTNCTGEATCLARMSNICGTTSGPVG